MTDLATSKNFPWRSIRIFFTCKLTILQILANLAGAGIVTSYFMFFDPNLKIQRITMDLVVIGIMFVVLVLIATFFLRHWQKVLMQFVELKIQDQAVDLSLVNKAKQKILNLPWVCSLTSLFNWLLAAIIMTIYYSQGPVEGQLPMWFPSGLRTFVGVIIAGIVTCAIVFFTIEIHCRKIWPYFFPDGDLMQTPGVFRLKLRNRMLIIFGLASLLPIILMAVLSYNKAKMMLVLEPQDVIGSLLYLTAFLLVVVLATAIYFSRIFATSIIAPVSQLEHAMARVEGGDFAALVPVDNNDELGALAEHFNQMTEGLKERYRLQHSLDLAKEVQQNLLPREDPVVEGLDVAGRSIYCDETGGDYFDFLSSSEVGPSKFGVLIGDVSGHGIPSALLMATARAFVRQRSSRSGSMAEIVSDVNRQLTRDVEDTGRFMTLFYLLIDLEACGMSWVRAGHDPAIWYDPANGRLEELHGEGTALGVDENIQFVQYQKPGLKKGQILLLSTDGLWETQNPSGSMFGKDRVYEIIRQKSSASAREILDTIVAESERFRQNLEPEDDITLVVIKIET
ncbi:MAG: SpoIIE family protein phosphatase [Deltaproteobacteria bacterium]|nr:SpoIIE family protein phosphatase [Deltaproteobacteria bacterium]